jgi:tetratricopeptide (TPR) repeat protein
MATIELEAGEAARARALLLEVARATPSLAVLSNLARLEQQMGRLPDALAHAERAVKLARAAHDLAEAHLLIFDVLLEMGSPDRALAALDAALASVQKLGDRGSAAERIRTALLSARILRSYGDSARASQALAHAVSLTQGDPSRVDDVMLAAVAHAFVDRDVETARAALQLGFSQEASEASMVRAALWLMLLETELDATPDGKVERVLLPATEGDGWWNMAARWARHLASDADFLAASATHVDKARASFYIAMRARARKAGPAGNEELRGPAFWEPEGQLGRALLAPRVTAPIPETASGS